METEPKKEGRRKRGKKNEKRKGGGKRYRNWRQQSHKRGRATGVLPLSLGESTIFLAPALPHSGQQGVGRR